ncbi:MAG: hypothetical protein K1X66_07800 [Verrucomicrobiae bacterium]|nr:hypothetical protein [Verrucomicrobiae bacterium]
MDCIKLQLNLVISKRFLNRSGFLILTLFFVGFAGYFFIDWRFLWPTPSLDLTKNQEGFYQTSFPSRVGLAPYVRNYLYDYFLTNQAPRLNFDTSPQITFYDRLSAEKQKKFNDDFHLESGNERKALIRLLASYTNVFMQVDQDKITINTGAGNSLSDSLLPPARGRLATLMLFDKKQGLFLKAPFFSYGTYLVKINHNNLRAFIEDEKGYLEDKSYPQICRSLAQIQKANFYWRLTCLFVEGYRPEIFSELSQDEKNLLVDIGGIYMAEVWRMKSMNLKKDILQILPEACLLSLYFNNGGHFYISEKIQPSLRSYQSCRHFSLPHRDFVFYAEPHDQAISTYLSKKHLLLYLQLQWLMPGESDRLLKNLSRYLDNPTYYSLYVKWLIKRLINILQKDAKLV